MKRRYLIWMVGSQQLIRVVVDGAEDCAAIEAHLDKGVGAIRYGEGKAHRSYLLARNVSHYHVEEM